MPKADVPPGRLYKRNLHLLPRRFYLGYGGFMLCLTFHVLIELAKL